LLGGWGVVKKLKLPNKNIVKMSQLGQDLWVLEETGNKRNGYFVDIGTNDPVNINNTYILEKIYGWDGICVEPLPELFEKIKSVRSKNTIVDNSLLFSSVKQMEFKMASGLSGIVETFDKCHDRSSFNDFLSITTTTLNKLLEKYNAPTEIDYISVDTEGSEFEILKVFNFQKYNVKLFTIEHNFNQELRDNIFKLMAENGYDRVSQDKQYPFIVKANEKWRRKGYKKDKIFEDWYIKAKPVKESSSP
jgi:FkbM family methyltransferase